MKRTFTSTTALVAALGIAAPTTLTAQTAAQSGTAYQLAQSGNENMDPLGLTQSGGLENALETAQDDDEKTGKKGKKGKKKKNAKKAGNKRKKVDQADKDKARKKADRDDVEKASAEAQKEFAEKIAANSRAAAAASGQGDVIDRQTMTVTEEMARSSGEEFRTDAKGRKRGQNAGSGQTIVVQDDDDDEFWKYLGTAAVAGLGGYALGRMLDGGGQVVANTGDRVVIEQDGQYRVIKDDDALLRRPGNQVETETYADGSSRTVVTAPDGTRTITIRSGTGQVLRRSVILTNGEEVVLIDDTRDYAAVDLADIEVSRVRSVDYAEADSDALRQALLAQDADAPDRAYSLSQVRFIDGVRHLVPEIALDAINFRTDSAVIDPREAQDLSDLGNAMREAINDDPSQVFLIEGHTDTVGTAAYNLALSDRRAESLALALTEYFDVPPANMIVQGYGEADLKVAERGDIRANRRAAVRNNPPLLRGDGSQG